MYILNFYDGKGAEDSPDRSKHVAYVTTVAENTFNISFGNFHGRAFTKNSQNKTKKYPTIKIIYFMYDLSQLRHVSICLYHRQGLTEHQ